MIDLSFLREHPVAVLGLGKTGLPSALALQESGVPVWGWDDTQEAVDAARSHGIGIADLTVAALENAGILLLSPGIPHSFPAPHRVVTRAKAAGLEIVGDIELLLRADADAKVVGITGTNGKSTTTALIGHVLRRCGIRTAVGGNLGPAALGFDRMGREGVYVLELSSYQLELTPSLAPDVGVLLNITPDHLERHGGMEGYVAAKRSLFRNGDKPQTAVIGIDDAHCRSIADTLGQEHGFTVVTLSVATAEATVSVCEGRLRDSRSGFSADLSDLPALRGAHNWQNMGAAFAACRAMGLEASRIIEAVATFPGLEHRQQLVADIDGVAYVNDSKATNADAAEKALSCYDSIYWIAGGLPKEGGLNGLDTLMPRVRHAFLIGKAADEFGAWLDGKAAYTKCGTLENAVFAANDLARREGVSGAVVLLSPACASWDQFRSFEQRGEVFVELVQRLKQPGVAA